MVMMSITAGNGGMPQGAILPEIQTERKQPKAGSCRSVEYD